MLARRVKCPQAKLSSESSTQSIKGHSHSIIIHSSQITWSRVSEWSSGQGWGTARSSGILPSRSKMIFESWTRHSACQAPTGASQPGPTHQAPGPRGRRSNLTNINSPRANWPKINVSNDQFIISQIATNYSAKWPYSQITQTATPNLFVLTMYNIKTTIWVGGDGFRLS